MKKFMSGFIVAAILFSVMPVKAAIEEYICYKADYKVMVSGTEYTNSDLPILNYKGNTYAPFRSILETAGLTVTWNAELKQAEVTTPTVLNTINEGEITLSEVSNYNFTTYKGCEAIEQNGEIYVALADGKTIFGYDVDYVEPIVTLYNTDKSSTVNFDKYDINYGIVVYNRFYLKVSVAEQYFNYINAQ